MKFLMISELITQVDQKKHEFRYIDRATWFFRFHLLDCCLNARLARLHWNVAKCHYRYAAEKSTLLDKFVFFKKDKNHIEKIKKFKIFILISFYETFLNV